MLARMYELDINAEPEHFLDWDKPATAQPPNVQDALGKIWQQLGGTTEGRQYPPFAAHSEATGESVHAALATALGSKEAAAAALRDAGVPGVRYLDQGSRGIFNYIPNESGGWTVVQKVPGKRDSVPVQDFATKEEAQSFSNSQGTSNYVMFDPALITILRKYGLMGPVAGAGLLGAAEQQ
jgi:hypothetical protein